MIQVKKATVLRPNITTNGYGTSDTVYSIKRAQIPKGLSLGTEFPFRFTSYIRHFHNYFTVHVTIVVITVNDTFLTTLWPRINHTFLRRHCKAIIGPLLYMVVFHYIQWVHLRNIFFSETVNSLMICLWWCNMICFGNRKTTLQHSCWAIIHYVKATITPDEAWCFYQWKCDNMNIHCLRSVWLARVCREQPGYMERRN